MDYMVFHKETHLDFFFQNIHCAFCLKYIKVTTLALQSALYHLREATTYLGLIQYFVAAAQE